MMIKTFCDQVKMPSLEDFFFLFVRKKYTLEGKTKRKKEKDYQCTMHACACLYYRQKLLFLKQNKTKINC